MNIGTYRRFCLILLAACLLLPFRQLTAQSGPVAVVEYASSDDITIIRNGRRLNFTDSFGLELLAGDQIQTGRSVAMEIRFVRNNARIRVTENTTFVLEAQGSDDSGLRLVYGRVRAKVERLTGTETFSVQSSGAIAGVRGTDFGYDFVANRGATLPLPRIYCFEGLVEVTALVRTPATQAENLEPVIKRFVLDAGSMVEIQPPVVGAETVKTQIAPEIRGFWEQNDFKDQPGVPSLPEASGSATEVASTAAEPLSPNALPLSPDAGQPAGLAQQTADPTPAPGTAPIIIQADPIIRVETEYVYVRDEAYAARLRQASSLKNGGIVAGINLIGLGIGLSLYGTYLANTGQIDNASQFNLYGAIIAGSALPFLLVTLLVKP